MINHQETCDVQTTHTCTCNDGQREALLEAARLAGVPLTEVVEAFRKFAEEVTKATDILADYVKPDPPKNIPHDPALRKDRRKWGGR